MSLLKRLGGLPQEPTSSDSLPPPPLPEAGMRSTLTSLGDAPPPPPPELPPLEAPKPSGISALGPQSMQTSTVSAGTQQKMLEMSLWIVDRIQASLGSQTQLERNADSERMMQERFATFYRQASTNLNQEEIKQLYQMVL